MTGLIDAHVHVWDPSVFRYRWLDGQELLDRAYLPAEYGQHRAVFVQADCAPDEAVSEARWVAGLAWPALAGIVAAIDLRSPSIEADLDDLCRIGRVVGVRHLLQDETPEQLADPKLVHGLSAVAARGLTFDACVRHTQLSLLEPLLQAEPQLRVVLDHVGKPPVADGIDSRAGARWQRDIHTLATAPRLHIKLSGLAAEVSAPTPSFDRHADEFLRAGLAAFGARRSMIGSDWPVSSRLGAAVAPEPWFARVRAATSTADDWKAVAAETASSFYRLSHPASQGDTAPAAED